MTAKRPPIWFRGVGLAIAIVSSGVALPALASSPSPLPNQPLLLAQRTPKIVYVRREVSGNPPGGRYRGGGSRSIQAMCPATALPLTAIVPFQEVYEKGRESLPPIVNVWGYTAAERPTVWVYVPYGNPAIPAKFTLDDDDAGTQIHTQAVTLPTQPGILGIRLPDSAPALQPGKRYRWYFSLTCSTPSGGMAGLDTVSVDAVVIREAPKPDLKGQLTAGASLQNAIAYAQAGFWYDALTNLAELRRQTPQDADLKAAWADLLAGIATTDKARTHFNLEKITAQPLTK